MNSHYPNAATSLMGNQQMYDDAPLKKKIKCLTSAQILCFVIGVAATGISVIALLKFNNLENGSSIPSFFVTEISDLQSQIRELKTQLSRENQLLQGTVMSGKNAPLPIEEILEDASPKTANGSPIPPGHERLLPEQDHSAHQGHSEHQDHSAHQGHSEHQDHSAHQDHSEHRDHDHSMHGHDEAAAVEPEEPPLTSHLEDTYIDAEDSVEGLLCDDSDLCSGPEGSGDLSIEDVLEGFEMDGSGDSSEDCPQFPRPACPKGAKMCFQGGKCPVPVCCFDD